MSKSWYAYIYGDPFSVSSYALLQGKHDGLCGTTICAIYLDNNGFYPKDPFSENIYSYIKDALTTHQMQPTVPFDARKFVYLKH